MYYFGIVAAVVAVSGRDTAADIAENRISNGFMGIDTSASIN